MGVSAAIAFVGAYSAYSSKEGARKSRNAAERQVEQLAQAEEKAKTDAALATNAAIAQRKGAARRSSMMMGANPAGPVTGSAMSYGKTTTGQ